MITVVGWPRSGTHLLKTMLEQVLGKNVTHSHPVPADTRWAVFVTRDPRDAFASHWVMYNYDHPGERTQMEHLKHHFEGDGLHHPHFAGGWVRYTEMALNRIEIAIRHEDIMSDPRSMIRYLVMALGVAAYPLDTSVIGASRCDPSDLPEDDRMGQRGKWREILEPEVATALWNYCGATAGKLGYTW